MDRSGFKTSNHARGQGAGRFESAAYTAVCEHFERSATPPPGVRRGYETTSTNRWWVYQRERFPVFRHGLLIAAVCFGALAFSIPAGERIGGSTLIRFATAFVTVFLFFLQLRIADEFKDCEDDRRCRPQRPVPRGLVTLGELKLVAAAGAAVQLGLALLVSPRLLLPLTAVWAYMLLMTWEFFAAAWLKRHAVIYLCSHTLILPLIYSYVSACGWFTQSMSPPGGLGWLLGFGFFSGLVVEIGRKVWAPGDEIAGVQTYSGLWGYKTATVVWATVALAAAVFMLRAAAPGGSIAPLLVLIAALGAAGFPCARRFIKRAQTGDAARIERMSGIWTLATHTGLGLVLLINR
jgi:4-hydroxybenzoate polyprenyltransferase